MGKSYKNYKEEDQNENITAESDIMEAPVEEPKKEEPKVEVTPAPAPVKVEAKKPTEIKGRGTVTC